MTYTATATTYSILNHLTVLTPSKGSKTKYHCPCCNSPNLDIHPRTGAYACFSGGCSPKDIRLAIDKLQGIPELKSDGYTPSTPPAWIKPIRPAQTTTYYYPSRDGTPLALVKRIDKGDGSKKDFPQQHYDKSTSQWKNGNPPPIKRQIPIYQYPQIQQAILKGELIWTVEGELTVEKLKEQSIIATTTIGGSGGFHNYGDYRSDLVNAMLILTPDRDKAGIKYIHNYIELFPNQILGVYLAGNIYDWTNLANDGRDIVDDINELGFNSEQLLERVISLEDYLEIISPKKNKSNDFTEPQLDYQELARQMGFKLHVLNEKTQPKSKQQKLKLDLYHWKNEDLRFNLMTREIELDGKTLDLNMAKDICSMIVGYDASTESCIQALTAVAHRHQYHPVKDYLNTIRSTTIDNNLLNNIATKFLGNNSPLANLMMRRKLIAAIARVMSPGVKDDSLLILQGKQGYLKSTFLRALTSDDWFCDNLMNLENKDELAKLSQHWILELAEVDYLFSHKKVELFKRFLSAQSDMYRPPYGRANVKVERTCSFWATTNKQEFLVDPTGNRRYWVVEVKQRIDIEAVKQMRDVIWATALAAYESGEMFHFTPDEDYQLNLANDSWADDEDPWADAISNQIAKYLTAQGSLEWIDINTIMDKILSIPLERQDKRQRNRIGGILQLAGFNRKTLRLVDLGVKKVWCRDLLPITLPVEISNEVGNSQNVDIATDLPLLPISKKEVIENDENILEKLELSNSQYVGSEISNNNNNGIDPAQSETQSGLEAEIESVTHTDETANSAAIGNNNVENLPTRLNVEVWRNESL
jgi:predicted P-loop ATPase